MWNHLRVMRGARSLMVVRSVVNSAVTAGAQSPRAQYDVGSCDDFRYELVLHVMWVVLEEAIAEWGITYLQVKTSPSIDCIHVYSADVLYLLPEYASPFFSPSRPPLAPPLGPPSFHQYCLISQSFRYIASTGCLTLAMGMLRLD